MAREAVASELHSYGMNKAGFMDSLQSLDQFIDNRSVLGFFIEQAVLRTIQSRGLNVDGKISNSMDMITFDDDFPTLNVSKERALYVPTGFNYRAVDGIVLWLDTSKQKGEEPKEALVYPIQVTIAESHSDSEKMFFNQWGKWMTALQGFDVKVTFLWITNQEPWVQDIPKKSRKQKNGDKLINPAYTSQNITIEYVNKDIWRSYRRARGIGRGDVRKLSGVRKHGPLEVKGSRR